MVDINLIGEEESRQQNYSGESGFGQGINLDNDAPAAAPPGGYGSDFSDLSTGSGNAKLYVILGALVIVIAAAIYFLIPEDESMDDGSLPTLTDPSGEMQQTQGGMSQTDNPALSEGTQNEGDIDAPIQAGGESDMDTFNSLTPLEKKMLLSTRMSAYTISELAAAISDGAVFTLIRFSDNAFMAQFVSNSNSGISATMDRIASDVDVKDVRKVSQGKFVATSRVQAIVSGTVDPETAPISYGGQIKDMSVSEFRTWLKQAASDNGMSLKTLNQSSEYTEAGFTVTPIQVNLQGSMDGATRLLSDLASAAPAMVVTKASLINKDPGARDQSSVSLVLVFNLYSY